MTKDIFGPTRDQFDFIKSVYKDCETMTLKKYLELWYQNKLPGDLYQAVLELLHKPTGWSAVTEPIFDRIVVSLPTNRDFSALEFVHQVFPLSF